MAETQIFLNNLYVDYTNFKLVLILHSATVQFTIGAHPESLLTGKMQEMKSVAIKLLLLQRVLWAKKNHTSPNTLGKSRLACKIQGSILSA